MHIMYLLRVGSRGTRLRVGTSTTRWSKLATGFMTRLDMKSLESEFLPRTEFATPIMPGMPDASGLHEVHTEAEKLLGTARSSRLTPYPCRAHENEGHLLVGQDAHES